MDIISATNPRRNANGSIDLDVTFEGIDGPVAFTADPNDSMAYGRDLYARAESGEFGEVVISSIGAGS